LHVADRLERALSPQPLRVVARQISVHVDPARRFGASYANRKLSDDVEDLLHFFEPSLSIVVGKLGQ